MSEKVVLTTVTYNKSPEMSLAALYDQFSELGIDYVDVFFGAGLAQMMVLASMIAWNYPTI